MAGIIEEKQGIVAIDFDSNQVQGASILPDVPKMVIGNVHCLHDKYTVDDGMPNQDNCLTGMALCQFS